MVEQSKAVGLDPQNSLNALLDELLQLREDILAETADQEDRIAAADEKFKQSATNLLHYLALRRRDMRVLQRRLTALGLSSLGRAEPHVLATLDAVLRVLVGLTGREWGPERPCCDPAAFDTEAALLAEHADCLFGDARLERRGRIMVTMPAEAADNYALVLQLLEQGMDCARINCAHDDADVWSRIIGQIRRAEEEVGRTCKIAMDLAGPKLRTGSIEAGPEVIRIRPTRDELGRVVAPARIWFTRDAGGHPPPTSEDAWLAVAGKWVSRLRIGDQIKLTDARGAHRNMLVVDVTQRGCWAEADQTIYLTPATALRHQVNGKGEELIAHVATFPGRERSLRLFKGDLLILTRDPSPGRAEVRDSAGLLLSPAVIGCTLPEVLDEVRTGESIWFDDGKIGGTILSVDDNAANVRITHAKAQGTKLRADKGINFPDSALRLPAMTGKDVEDLSFVVEHADIVELSFANSSEDVSALQAHIAQLGVRRPAIVLKIETRRGFQNLPDMLLTALESPCCGVMIARGDLAVEAGFERLAEVQEEILWVCEAAHVPVVWATQVLETLAKDGMPSRAEVTDAAMSDRAECVMLNKGPYIVDAVKALDSILRRMQAHQSKKQSMLRKLQLADILE